MNVTFYFFPFLCSCCSALLSLLLCSAFACSFLHLFPSAASILSRTAFYYLLRQRSPLCLELFLALTQQATREMGAFVLLRNYRQLSLREHFPLQLGTPFVVCCVLLFSIQIFDSLHNSATSVLH